LSRWSLDPPAEPKPDRGGPVGSDYVSSAILLAVFGFSAYYGIKGAVRVISGVDRTLELAFMCSIKVLRAAVVGLAKGIGTVVVGLTKWVRKIGFRFGKNLGYVAVGFIIGKAMS
jgi:hypothetical protein